MNSSLTSRFGFSSTASHEHASEEAKVCDQSEQVEAADQTKESGLNKESEAFAEKLFDTLARQRGIQGGSINKIQVDKDADGKITEEEIKEIDNPGDALVAWTRGNYKRKKIDTQPWDEVLVAWGGQGRVVISAGA
ncbi:Respiratory burst oxidase C [Glycine max]|nr:Respiratory burst oxidase C [Glycine max]